MGENNLFEQSFTGLKVRGEEFHYYSLRELERTSGKQVDSLPYSLRLLLENMLRFGARINGCISKAADVEAILNWQPNSEAKAEIPYMPARVVMQDFTGVPAVVDLAAMRESMEQKSYSVQEINPLVETDLVIDHSVQVDFYGERDSFQKNIEKEYERNRERYLFLKWAQKSFKNFKVVPPGVGIIHQVNLEYLASLVKTKKMDGRNYVYPDTLVGTDSHTTMINGIGVLGWGVGGIEAEAVMLGRPYYMLIPEVVGVNLFGRLTEGVTATDLVLSITEVLRKKNVVGKFIEFYGEGLGELEVADRATIANMAPEYGATMGFFPADEKTLDYLQQTGRDDSLIELARTYLSEQKLLFDRNAMVPVYSEQVDFDLTQVEASLAGPKRPQDRVSFSQVGSSFKKAMSQSIDQQGFGIASNQLDKQVDLPHDRGILRHGSVVIASITSCTNTSNPAVMLGAGLLAKKAYENDLISKSFVKTSLAPGSQVVTEYLKRAGLLAYLEALRFNVVGYGCTTCIGNSGKLDDEIIEAIVNNDLVASAVLSGNRNFEGRVNPHVRANYLASPLHVIAYALAGNIDFDFHNKPLGKNKAGKEVYLRDIWPTSAEISAAKNEFITPNIFRERYQSSLGGDDNWHSLTSGSDDNNKSGLYDWDERSTYIQCPDFFSVEEIEKSQVKDIVDAKALLVLGDSVTTDHISPAGAIPVEYPSGAYLKEKGVKVADFNSYGSRRGNHEVMVRGTFANIRIKNALLKEPKEGGYTIHIPTDREMFVYEAAMLYKQSNTPLIVIAGKEYGTGSSRDWAAKGTRLLGIKAVFAESYERIHRNNLVGMGVLPLQFLDGQSKQTLGITGYERFTLLNLNTLAPRQEITVAMINHQDEKKEFRMLVRLDTDIDIEDYKNGGILQTVLKNKFKSVA